MHTLRRAARRITLFFSCYSFFYCEQIVFYFLLSRKKLIVLTHESTKLSVTIEAQQNAHTINQSQSILLYTSAHKFCEPWRMRLRLIYNLLRIYIYIYGIAINIFHIVNNTPLVCFLTLYCMNSP